MCQERVGGEPCVRPSYIGTKALLVRGRTQGSPEILAEKLAWKLKRDVYDFILFLEKFNLLPIKA